MAIMRILFKNAKNFLLNPYFMAFLVFVPIFQIGMVSSVINSATGGSEGYNFINMITTQKTLNNNMTELLASGILVQAMLLTGVLASSVMVTEREKNTLQRMYAAPVSKFNILSGVLLGNTIISLVITSIIVLISGYFQKIHWGNPLYIGLIILLASLVSGSFALFISGIFKNSKIITGVMSVVIVSMTLLSGGLFPIDNLGIVPNFTLNKWISDAFLNTMKEKGFESITINLITMAAFTVVFLAGAALLYRRESSK